jgi:CheY-like chemotaxis protein
VPLTIVIVDDDLDFRLIVRALVKPEADSIQVVGEAEDGEKGLAVVRRERPDVVITDLVMPRMNGVELTRRVRDELPDTRNYSHQLVCRRGVPAHGLRQRGGCLRAQAGDHRQLAASDPRRSAPTVLWRKRLASADRGRLVGVSRAAVLTRQARSFVNDCEA